MNRRAYVGSALLYELAAFRLTMDNFYFSEILPSEVEEIAVNCLRIYSQKDTVFNPSLNLSLGALLRKYQLDNISKYNDVVDNRAPLFLDFIQIQEKYFDELIKPQLVTYEDRLFGRIISEYYNTIKIEITRKILIKNAGPVIYVRLIYILNFMNTDAVNLPC